MQAAGDLVAAAAELAASVQNGQDDLDGRLLLARHLVDRNTPPVVADAHPAVRLQYHRDHVAVAGEGLVDGVVDHLVDQVMETALTGRTDVHAGPLADRLETYKHLDRAGVVLDWKS